MPVDINAVATKAKAVQDEIADIKSILKGSSMPVDITAAAAKAKAIQADIADIRSTL